MLLPITSSITALLILVQVVLTFRVIGARRRENILVGDGNNDHLIVRMRSHANFVEVTPITLVAFALCEIQTQQSSLLIPLGLTLIVGRILHTLGMEMKRKLILRQLGMVMTLGTMLVLAGYLLITVL